ncbi:MAG: DsbA family protein [Pseudomonadota bacterium]
MMVRVWACGALAVGFVLGVTAMWGSSFADEDRFNQDEEAAIEAIVEQYLQDNPSVVFNAVQRHLELEQQAEDERLKSSVAANLAKLQSETGGFAAGASAEDASVTIVEFFDYHCGYCKKATGAVMKLLQDDPTVRVVFKEYPILVDESHVAAKAAMAARDQDKYLDFHLELMRAAGKLTDERIDSIAEKVGIDVAKMRAAMGSPEIEADLLETRELAQSVGITGTPTFLVNDEVIPGWAEERLHEMIAQEQGEPS